MEHTYWHKQTVSQPLFADLMWSRPQNTLHAGKLLIIGGNAHGFAAPGEAYTEAVSAGVGVPKVVLPNVLQKTVGTVLENCEFVASNKSGSFAQNALADWLSFASWADGVLLAGDLGRNSETAIVLEKFIEKYRGLLVLTKDAVDYFKDTSLKILERPETTLVLSLAQLQKLAVSALFSTPITFSMTLPQLVDALHELTQKHAANIVVNHNNVLCVAVEGEVSTTQMEASETWRVKAAAHVAVWWLQNPTKPFASFTTSVVQL
jgi:hypothetical protein